VDNPESTVEVPPAAGEEVPTWGLLQFGVKIADVGPKQLRVGVGLTAGDNAQVPMSFDMLLIGVPPFQLMPPSLQFGELAEGATPVTKEVIYWSATRGPGTNPPLVEPKVTPNASDPFLTVGKPIALTAEEMARFTTQVTIEAKSGPIRVAGAYKVPVTLSRSRPGANPPEPDIGPYDRQLGFTAVGTLHTVQVPVTATVTGLVSLVGGDAANLREFNGRVERAEKFSLSVDRAVLALRPLPDESKPRYLKPDVKPAGGQYWTLFVTVPEGSLLGTLPTDSVVVLEAKVADGVRKVRIPVKGTGFLGARPK
jgi:hypothetical protein